MVEAWIAYALVFAAIALVAHFGLRGMDEAALLRRQTQRRRAALTSDAGEASVLRRQRRSMLLGRRIEALNLTGGNKLPLSRLVLAGACLALALYVVLPVPGTGARTSIALLVTATTLGLWLRLRAARRRARFGEQLPDVIDIIVRSLRAGHPLPVSLALVAREMPEPAGPEFMLVVEEVNYGRSISEALEGLHARVGYPDLQFFVAATTIAHQTGGNLGEILARLATLLRQRFRLRRRIRALSAEGRFSGLVLSALPVALFGLINVVSKSYYADFWVSASASTIVAVSVGLLVVGNLIIIRLVNFRV